MTALYNNFFSRFGFPDNFTAIKVKILRANSSTNFAKLQASTNQRQLLFTLVLTAKQNG